MENKINPDSVLRCSSHKNARAAWECTKCGKALCPSCAAADHIEKMGDVIRCIHCGGIAKAIMVRHPVDPWWKHLPMLLKTVFSARGAMQMILVGLALLAAGFMMIIPLVGWILGFIVYFGVMASYLFMLLRAGTDGAEKLPPLRDMGSDFSDLAASSFRLLVATWVLWLPVIIYFASSGTIPTHASAGASVPVIIFIGIGVIYIPAAFILAALADSAIDAMNPLMVIGIITRAPDQYLGVALVSGVLFLGNGFLEQGIKLALGPQCIMNFAKTFALLWLVKSITLFLPALVALILGWFIHQNAEVFDLPGGGDWCAVMPKARPMGRLSEEKVEQNQPQSRNDFPQALDLESTPEQALAGSLKMGNDAIALDSYRKVITEGRVPELDVDYELMLAQILERAGDLKGAVYSYRRAVKTNIEGPKAPHALFNAARILHDGLDAKGDAEKLAKILVDRFPGHELALQAQRFLA